ncbi:MAG: hypothetical protein HY690_20265 [Chloroflexi bacterium]|nr:hypothetical protein [Chloroflexota bacterium]
MRKRVLEGPTPYEMSPEMDAQVTAMIEQADRDVEEMRVNMRWGRAQVDVIKRAAALYGMPYQTYVKQAAFRQALADLKEAEAIVSKL